jgi:hypothetical protein
MHISIINCKDDDIVELRLIRMHSLIGDMVVVEEHNDKPMALGHKVFQLREAGWTHSSPIFLLQLLKGDLHLDNMIHYDWINRVAIEVEVERM